MSGPIVRTGATRKFSENWDRIFGDQSESDKKTPTRAKKTTKAAKKTAKKKASRGKTKKATAKKQPAKGRSKRSTKKAKKRR
ncbi:MAG TPA: RNA polymerase subunit sigma [Planctomycetaceae bacterium]|nr:RNA polymerase subunit sigma [Planctomycetaceae bacterium]